MASSSSRTSSTCCDDENEDEASRWPRLQRCTLGGGRYIPAYHHRLWYGRVHRSTSCVYITDVLGDVFNCWLDVTKINTGSSVSECEWLMHGQICISTTDTSLCTRLMSTGSRKFLELIVFNLKGSYQRSVSVCQKEVWDQLPSVPGWRVRAVMDSLQSVSAGMWREEQQKEEEAVFWFPVSLPLPVQLCSWTQQSRLRRFLLIQSYLCTNPINDVLFKWCMCGRVMMGLPLHLLCTPCQSITATHSSLHYLHQSYRRGQCFLTNTLHVLLISHRVPTNKTKSP